MKNNQRILVGLIITVAIFAISMIIGSKLNLNMDFFPSSFLTHSIMFLLSIFMIYSFKKQVDYRISLPKYKDLLKPIIFGLLATIIVNIAMVIMTKILGGNIETHPLLTKLTPLQTFIFVFIYASIAEELLFRGFLLNLLKPLKSKGILILNRKISFSVVISALAFGFGHLILITSGVSGLFLFRVVTFTTILGLIAGYYQEKYDNNLFAIVVHMAGNLIGVLGALLMSLNQ
jgi:membrane protease YdiL (CAAX protease family)